MHKSRAIKMLAKAGIAVEYGRVSKSDARRALEVLVTADYSPEEWKKAEDHLKGWSLKELRDWAEEAIGPEGRKMPKSEIIDMFLENNGEQLIDELEGEGGSSGPKPKDGAKRTIEGTVIGPSKNGLNIPLDPDKMRISYVLDGEKWTDAAKRVGFKNSPKVGDKVIVELVAEDGVWSANKVKPKQ